MREVYYVEIKVEDKKNVEFVKNTVLMFCSYDYAMFDELAVEDSTENVEKRYKTNTLTDSEKNKLEELCEENDRIQTKIVQNIITLYLDTNDIVGGEANYWFGNFVALAEILPNINFEMKLERRNETIDAFSCGNGAYKNGVIWYYGTEFFPECTVRLNGIEYDCSQCRSPEDYPQFFEAGKFIDGEYVSLENVNITNVKDVAICFTEPKFYAEKEFFTKIMTRNGGFVRKDVSGKTNYLIYNPECGYETSNLRYAKELNEEGKNIKIVTVEEFIGKLCLSNKSDNDKKAIDDWMKIFELKNFRKGYAIAKYKGDETDVTIPATIDDIPVLKIGTEAFQNCKKVKSIDIPDSIVEIGNHTFEKCTSLENINLSSKIRVGVGAFEGCTNLTDENGFIIIHNVLFSCITKKEAITVPLVVIQLMGDK